MVDESNQRKIEITKDGLNDVVVWNPWADKAQKMADMDDEEYKEMVSQVSVLYTHTFL